MNRLRGRLGLAGLSLLWQLLGAGVVAAAVPAPALVGAESEIGFVSHQMGAPIAGTFRDFDAQVRFDPAAPQDARFVIGVQLSSVVLPTTDAMREVVKPEWFDAQHFPRAQFESASVRSTTRGHYEITGRLTIKGHAQEVVVPVALEQIGNQTVATGTIVVRRLAFSIGEGEWSDTSLVADEVQITFRLALTGIGPI